MAVTGKIVFWVAARCNDGLASLRDRALILRGFISDRRRSDVIGLQVGDLSFEAIGRWVTIRQSKTDQDGKGREIDATEPRDIEAVRAWISAAGIVEGLVFRSPGRHRDSDAGLTGQLVNLILKRCGAEARTNGAELLSGHSLRRVV